MGIRRHGGGRRAAEARPGVPEGAIRPGRTNSGAGGAAGVPPVFVVGMPRSGTTLLARLLETGAQHTALPESHFFSRFVWLSPHRRSLAALEAAWGDFARSLRWRLALRADELPRSVEGLTAPSRYRRVFLSWVERELVAAGSDPTETGWIENTPPHLEGLAFIRRLFPDARIIGVLRDPRAVHASLNAVDWNDAHPAANAERWRWYARALGRTSTRDPDHVRVVAYETLVGRPAETMAGLAQWLNIPFDLGELECACDRTHGFDVTTEPWKARALQPPDPTRVDDWRRKLPDGDLSTIERWAWPAAEAHGYERLTSDAVRPGFSEYRAALRMRARLVAYAVATRLRVASWRLR